MDYDSLDANGVEVTIGHDGKLWVHVDGVCRLRIGRIGRLTLEIPPQLPKQVYPRGGK